MDHWISHVGRLGLAPNGPDPMACVTSDGNWPMRASSSWIPFLSRGPSRLPPSSPSLSQPPLLEASRLLLRPWPRKPRRRPSPRYAAPRLLWRIISSGAHTSRSGLRDPVGSDLAGAPRSVFLRLPRAGSGYARRPDLGLLVGIVCLPLLIPKWRVVDLVGFWDLYA